LKKASKTEHLSGVHSVIVAACAGTNLSSSALSDALEINKKTAIKAKQKRQQYDQDPKGKLLMPPVLKKERLDPETEQMVKKFIEDNITPSSSTKNVRKKKKNGMIVDTKVKHWRVEPLRELHLKYNEKHPNNNVSLSAFYSRIPWYVYIKPQRTGLCIYHTKAHNMLEVLSRLRKEWHKDCKCQCQFCKKTEHGGCNHGKDSKDCAEGNCSRCSKICCPLEKSKTLMCTYTIAEYQYDTTNKGNKKLSVANNTYTKSRLEFMHSWQSLMDEFKPHADHLKHHKEQVADLFRMMESDPGIAITRWDFAENYVHESGAMVSTQHYGKEQSQLLIATYWIHEEKAEYRDDTGDGDTEESRTNIKLKYIAFTSDYLGHNTIFFNKCFKIFMERLLKNTNIAANIDYLYLLTDGSGQHFKNRRSYNNVSVTSEESGNHYFFFSNKIW
jgi:hypothetical protein